MVGAVTSAPPAKESAERYWRPPSHGATVTLPLPLPVTFPFTIEKLKGR